MLKRILLPVILSIVCVSANSAPSGERYIIQFKDGRGDNGRSAVINAGTIVRDLAGHNAVAARIPAAAIGGLERNPSVDFVEIDAKRYLFTHPSGGQVKPYGIATVQADQFSGMSPAVSKKVCIIDSGYDSSHEDLPTGMNVDGSNDPDTGDWFADGFGHGTHVAGTIAAADNGVGVIGVLPSGNATANLHIVRVFGDDGTWAYSSDLVAALDVCRDNDANVVSMSLGGSFKSRFEQAAFSDANAAGVLSVAAAGNDGNTRNSYPASYDSVVSVAATDINNQVADFSQRNSQVELAAPGVGVLSTLPSGLGTHSDLTVGVNDYANIAMDGSPEATESGSLVDCGLGDSPCAGTGDFVCLIQRGNISFADKVLNCASGGGSAAVIYNNESGALFGTLGGVATTIPSVGISDTDGTILLGALTSPTTVSVEATDYAAWDGTSMATPHVSGVAALVWSYNAACSNEDIRNALAATAHDIDALGRDNSTGHGLVQARTAVNLLSADGCGAGGGGGGGGGGGSCTLAPKGASCSDDSDCCSNKCKGRSGAKSCK